MFLETSALVAMLTNIEDATEFGLRLSQAKTRMTSPMILFEAAQGLMRAFNMTGEEACETLEKFLHLLDVKVLAVPPTVSGAALDVFLKYGETSGHSAALTMSECFSYACARYYRVPLLFKCPRFSKTYIE